MENLYKGLVLYHSWSSIDLLGLKTFVTISWQSQIELGNFHLGDDEKLDKKSFVANMKARRWFCSPL
jgi:hypothetical protein